MLKGIEVAGAEAHWLNVLQLHLHRHASHDHFHGKHHSKMILYAKQDPFTPGHDSGPDAHLRTRGKVRVRLNLPVPQAFAKPINIRIWNRRRLRSKAHDRSDARNL